MQLLFERFPLRWMRRHLQGALLVLCLASFACGHAKAAPVAKAASVAKMSSASAAPQQPAQADEPMQAAVGFDKLFLHDMCTAPYPPQPDTCLHEQVHKQSFKFGGKSGTVYDVTLRIRGIFEPTTITGGDTPDPQHPYFKVGGTVSTADWSRWEIEVSEPKQTYWLNHYPSVGHTIYKEDFEAAIAVAAGATVVIRVTDGNDRQIDNSKPGPDRQQIIPGVVDNPLSGQMLRLDVIRVKARYAASPGETTASANGPDAEVKEFRLDDLETRLRSMQPGVERDYFAGVFANRTGRSEDSIHLLNSALPALRESQPMRAAIALEALADDYTKIFRYSDAACAYDDLLTHFAKYSEWLPTEDSGIVHLLQAAPAQTITWQGPMRLKTERNPLGSRNAELTASGVRGLWLLDTGSTMSLVSRSFAQRLGLKPLPGSAQMGAGGTGIENPVQVAVLPSKLEALHSQTS